LTAPPADYVPDLILAGGPNLLWAQGGTGKSWLAAWLAVCIACGTPWLGPAVRAGHVLYHDLEAGGGPFPPRIVKDPRGSGRPAPPPHLHYRYCARPLVSLEETFASDLFERHIDVVMLDAVGGAEGERKEFADTRDGIMAIFGLMREHRVTSFLIDHVAGDGL